MPQNNILGYNGVDRVRSLRKIPTRLRGTEFRKATKRSRMHPNGTKHTKTSVGDPMGLIGCDRCEKFRRDFVA